MTITARPYRDLRDLKEMQAVLTAGQQAANHAYYVHPGDLSWWLFYTDENCLDTKICLWEWNSTLAGWSLLSNSCRTFDVFVRPELHGRSLEAKIMLWAEEVHSKRLSDQQSRDIRIMWVAEADRSRIQWLEMRGFRPSPHGMFVMQRSLMNDLPEQQPLAGYKVRPVAGEQEAHLRASVAHAAFGSQKPFDEYLPRLLRFMRSPVYNPDLDIVSVSPEGHFTSFCILWADETSRVGLFEPVGTHPNHRGQGLGKAVLATGLKRLRSMGMTQASVCVESNNSPAIHLYESMGFKIQNRLLTFDKPL